METTEKKAIELAIIYEKKNGAIEVIDVQKKGGDYKGCDLVSIYPENRILKIEVKGATRFHGIPDPYITEFNEETKEMIADFLYVFYFPREEDKNNFSSGILFYKIPKGSIKPEEIEIKKGWRIKKSFKNRMDNFKIEI